MLGLNPLSGIPVSFELWYVLAKKSDSTETKRLKEGNRPLHFSADAPGAYKKNYIQRLIGNNHWIAVNGISRKKIVCSAWTLVHFWISDIQKSKTICESLSVLA